MRINTSIIVTLIAVLSCACSHDKRQRDLDTSENNPAVIKEKLYSYYISDNITIESPVALTEFNLDFIDSYLYVEDDNGNVYRATLIDTKKPPIFQEGIYPDITDGKRKFFIYTDDTNKCNHIYIGTLLSTEQLIVAGFIPQQAQNDTFNKRKFNLRTPSTTTPTTPPVTPTVEPLDTSQIDRVMRELPNQYKDGL